MIPKPEIFRRNMLAIDSIFPSMRELLEGVASFAEYAEETPDDLPVWRLAGDQGPWIHSRRAPKREVHRLLNDFKPTPTNVIVVMGVGTGALIMELLRRFPKHSIVALERDARLLRTFYEFNSLGDELRNGRFFGALSFDGFPIANQLSDVASAIHVHGYALIQHSFSKNGEAYIGLLRTFAEWAEERSVEMRSEIFGIRDSLQNLFFNIPNYCRASGVEALKDTLKGVPAVLVGAGPSLDRNLQTLIEGQDKVFVLAVSTALRRVRKEGLRVDATNVVDWSHLSARYFEGIDDPELPLFVSPRAHPATTASWAGPLVMNDDGVYDAFFLDDLPKKGGLDGAANNVAHYAFNLLAMMGCSPIVFVGMDLSYSFHITHASGTAVHDDWLAGASRYVTLERQEVMSAGYAGGEHLSKDVYGNPLALDMQMMHAARTFEVLIEQKQGLEVINATEGGYPIKGAENKPLAEVLAGLPEKRPLLDAFYAEIQAVDEFTNLQKAEATLVRGETYNTALDENYKAAIKSLKGALNRIKRGKTPESVEGELQRISTKVKEWQGAFNCSSALCPSDKHLRNKRKQELEAADMPEMRRLKELTENEMDYLASLLVSHEYWKGILSDSLKLTREAIANTEGGAA